MRLATAHSRNSTHGSKLATRQLSCGSWPATPGWCCMQAGTAARLRLDRAILQQAPMQQMPCSKAPQALTGLRHSTAARPSRMARRATPAVTAALAMAALTTAALMMAEEASRKMMI